MKLIPTNILMLLLVLGTTVSFVFAEGTSLEQDLISRHFNKKSSDLVTVYGSEDQVVAELIKLRLVQSPPYVSTRAVKLLLGFSKRTDVQAVLKEDVTNEATLGLCSVILSNLNEVEDEGLRLELANLAVASISSTKSASLSRLNRIKSILSNSTDAKVKALVW